MVYGGQHEEAALSTVRLRLTSRPNQPLDLAQARLALFGFLWARSQGGELLASNENRAALDDLEWLGIEPDAMVSAPRTSRFQEVAETLVERRLAYKCYCTSAEMREMRPTPPSSVEPYHYDGRCRRLTAVDQAALEKAGRAPAVRLVRPSEIAPVRARDGRTWTFVPDWDFAVIHSDQQPSAAFFDLVNAHTASATHLLVDERAAADLAVRGLLATLLDWELPEHVIVADWDAPIASTGIAELRDAGYHPTTLLGVLARAGWDPGDATDLKSMIGRFSLDGLSGAPGPVDLNNLREANARVLQSLPQDEQFQSLVAYLIRRGHPITERDTGWQQRFVAATMPTLQTLGDAEQLAGLLLAPTVDYDREMASLLRMASTHEVIDEFARLMPSADSDEEVWRDVLQRFRSQVSAPGRALSTLRIVLTGQRTGPTLAPLLALLGPERCRSRIEKARRYAGRA